MSFNPSNHSNPDPTAGKPSLGTLPQMNDYDEAVALSKQRGDHFLVCAFMLREWLADLVIQACASYANGTARPSQPMQTGLAWAGLLDLFDQLPDNQFHHASAALFRFINYDHPLAELLLRSRAPLHIEHDITGDFAGRRTLHLAKLPQHAVPLLRCTLQRWCDWLDAVIHLEVHRGCQLGRTGALVTKDDELAAFGYNLCKLPLLNQTPPLSRGLWHPSGHLQSPQALLDSSASGNPPSCKTWPGEEPDTLLIALQPLASRYRWSPADLLKILHTLLRQPCPFPLCHESGLAGYRRTELGLPPLPDPAAPQTSTPEGFALALALCPPPDSATLGEAPWS